MAGVTKCWQRVMECMTLLSFSLKMGDLIPDYGVQKSRSGEIAVSAGAINLFPIAIHSRDLRTV